MFISFLLVICILTTVSFVSAADLQVGSQNLDATNNQGTMSSPLSFTDLNETIHSGSDNISLNHNYIFSEGDSDELKQGIVIDKPYTVIDGNNHIISGEGVSRIFNITADYVTIKNIVLINGNSSNGSASYWSGNNGLMDNCNVFDCTSQGYGGALIVRGDNFKLSNSKLHDNYASIRGGSIAVLGTNTIIENSVFENNYAAVYGGAIYATSKSESTLKVDKSKFLNNEAGIDAGAIFSYQDSIITDSEFNTNNVDIDTGINAGAVYLCSNSVIDNCVFIDNFANNYGGAVYLEGNEATVTNCNFLYNDAELGAGALYSTCKKNLISNCRFDLNGYCNGSAIYLNTDSSTIIENCEFNNNFGDVGTVYVTKGSTLEVTDSVFSNNHAYNHGGAIYGEVNSTITVISSEFNSNYIYSTNGGAICSYGDLYVTGSTFYKNKAILYAGAIYTEGLNTFISDCIFSNNEGNNGSGAVYTSSDNIIIKSSLFYLNKAKDKSGGAIYCDGNGEVEIDDCSFIKNSANSDGGAIFVEKQPVTINNCEFYENSAEYNGGALYLGVGGEITNSSFIKNSATNNGGAILNENDLTISDCAFINNQANNTAGAIYYLSGANMILNSYIANNNAGRTAGAIYSSNNSGLMIMNSTLENNTSLYSGAVESEGLLIIIKDTFRDNSGIAGAISTKDNLIVSFSTFDNNKGYFGGAISGTENSNISIVNSEFSNNNAVYSAGAINAGNCLYISNNAFINNSARTGNDICGRIMIDVELINETSANITFTSTIDDATGFINITIDNEESVSIPFIDGKAAYYVDNLSIGKHSIDASYQIGNDFIFTGFTEFTNVNLIVDDLTKYYGSKDKFVLYLTDYKGNPIAGESVIISLNEKNYTVKTDNEGIATLSINLLPGEYGACVSYKNIVEYKTITVKQTVIGKDVVKYFKNDTQYYATFLNSTGNVLTNTTVSFNINGVIYYRTTDEHGIAGININLAPGDYEITATNPVTGELSTNIIKVLPTLEGQDLEMTYLDGSTYQVKLVDGEGNPVSGAEIALNINGVIYYKTTDDDGIAKLTINLNPGEYIISCQYGEALTSNKIKVNL